MNISAIVGRLTKDMEFIPFTNQSTGKTGYKARGTVAVDREFTGKGGKKETDFIPVQAWITDAQKEKYHGVYMKKGAVVSVNGSIRVENYQDKETQKNRTFTVIQGDIQVVSNGAKSQGQGDVSNQGHGGFNQGNGGYTQGNQQFDPASAFGSGPSFEEMYNDDVPF